MAPLAPRGRAPLCGQFFLGFWATSILGRMGLGEVGLGYDVGRMGYGTDGTEESKREATPKSPRGAFADASRFGSWGLRHQAGYCLSPRWATL